MDLTIAQARPEHVQPVRDLLVACTKDLLSRRIDQWDDLYPDLEAVDDEVAAGSVYVAVDGATCIASVSLDELPDAAYAGVSWRGGEPALIMHRLCVDPRQRGRGFGRRMVQFAEELAVDRGCASVRLDAYIGNLSAVRLYERCGFNVAGKVRYPRRRLSFYCMEKVLREA